MAARRPILLALDQGTTSSKAAVIDGAGRVLGMGSASVISRHGAEGSVHQDPRQILASQWRAIRQACARAGHPRLDAAGVASQRSTFVLWDRATGRPCGPAPTWQSTEGADLCRKLAGRAATVRRRTGLFLSPHYSASKIARWLAHDRALAARARRDEILCGSPATWLIWKMTQERRHGIDPTLAARTLLFSLRSGRWDPWLLELFGIPAAILPEVMESVDEYGTMRIDGHDVPVRACLGDQQAALHAAVDAGGAAPGRALVNYGTGAFVLIPAGRRPVQRAGLLTSFAVYAGDRRFMLEGTINPAGAALDWLRREMGAPVSERRLDSICRRAPGGCAVVASFWGMGSSDMEAPAGSRAPAAALGLAPVSTRDQIIRATVEGIAHGVADAIERAGAAARPRRLVASGGLAGLRYLVEYQAALLGIPIEVQPAARWREATLLGAARAAARGLGHDLPVMQSGRVVTPPGRLRERALEGYARWQDLIGMTRPRAAGGRRPA